MNTKRLLNTMLIVVCLTSALATGPGALASREVDKPTAVATEWVGPTSLPNTAPESRVLTNRSSPNDSAVLEPALLVPASAQSPNAGSHTWDDDADFAGTFDFTEVVSGSGQITLARTWSANVRVNDDAGGAQQYRPSVGAYGVGNAYVIWEDARNSGNADIYFSKSIDGGRSWLSNTGIVSETASAVQPNLAVGGNGDLAAAWRDYRDDVGDIFLSRSSDQGDIWSAHAKVSDAASGSIQGTPSLAVGSAGLYAAWTDYRNGADGDVYFSRSTDEGQTWSPNVRVSDDTGSGEQLLPDLAVGGNGHLYAMWSDSRDLERDIYFARSTDQGNTWSANVKINDDDTGLQDFPSLAVDHEGALLAVWGDGRNGDQDIFFSRSTDGGVSWSENVRVSDHTNSAPQHRPSLVVDKSGGIHVAWTDERNVGGADFPDIYYSRSSDSGQTWSANVQVNEDVGDHAQKDPSLAVDDSGNLYLAWQDDRNSNPDIYAAYWPENGQNYTQGTYTSAPYDTQAIVAWDALAWSITVPVGTMQPPAITVTVRTGNSAVPDERWSDWMTLTTSPADLSALPSSRYLQWRAEFTSPVATTTPSLDALTVSWRDAVDYTEVGGIISFDTTWSAANSPYRVTSNLVVDIGATLTVEPGVTVWFEDDRALRVVGELVAQGTASQPITFTSWHVQGEPGDWGAIAFSDTAAGASFDNDGNYSGGSALQYVTLEYAGGGAFEYAIDAPYTPLYVDHCTIRNNGAGGIRVGGSTDLRAAATANGGGSHITFNAIHDNQGRGIRVTGNGTVIASNTISDNSPGPENNTGSGVYVDGDAMVIENNTISDNLGNGIRAYGYGITITHNLIRGNGTAPGAVPSSGGGIFASGGGSINGNTIQNNTGINGGGIYSIRGNSWEDPGYHISGNTIESNSASGEGGAIWVHGGSITFNTIVSNTSASLSGGVYNYREAEMPGYDGDHAILNHNAIWGNSGYGLYNGAAFDPTRVDARYNWWGTADEAAIQDQIYDYWDDAGSGIVDYNPYLLERPDLKPAGINLSGPTAGLVNTPYSFDASVYPLAVLPPVTHTWQATGHAPVIHTGDDLHDTIRLSWVDSGTKSITVTVRNSLGFTFTTHAIEIVQNASFDSAENDDSCAQSREISTDGVPQTHTFHETNDVDWVFFDARSDTTFIIEAITPDDSEADVALELYDACDGTIQGGQDNSFSPDISLSFAAPRDGAYYLKLSDNRATSGDQAASYYLSVRAVPETAQTGAVVVVAGKNKEDDPLQSNIYHVTNAVYNLFQANGYNGDDIAYLAPDMSLDADRDGAADVDTVSTKAALQQAITAWAVGKLGEGDPFTLYMMDHGGYDVFYLNLLSNRSETVSAYELDTWLNQLEAAVPGVKINVILEACRSGSFIDLAQTASGPGRVIIASTGAYPLAYASDQGAVFSDAFIGALGRGMSLLSSFEEARWAVRQAHPSQTPWLDDDGDGAPNDLQDGLLAAERGFTYAGTLLGEDWPPYIAQASVDLGTGIIEAQVQIHSSKTISEVWALVYAPSYRVPESGEDMIQENVPRVALRPTGEEGLYRGTYDAFTEPGTYRVVVNAVDNTGLSAQPRAVEKGKAQVYLPLLRKTD